MSTVEKQKNAGNESSQGEQKKPVSDFKIRSVRDLIDGSLLTRKAILRQLPFVLFLSFLAVLYIGNRYHAIRIMRETMKVQDELKELRANSITTAAQLMNLSRQSQLVKMVQDKGLDLKESVVPPKVLK